jgi:putative ABC transport system permease protein
MMRLSGLRYFYRQRLKEQAVPELFAGLGIAVAVALVFAVTVASSSITSSAAEVNRALVGPASLQLRARGPDGMDERLLSRVEALAGVAHAAPLLEESATIVAGDGASVSVNLAGTDVSLAVLDGLVHTLPVATLSKSGLGLSTATAGLLGIPRIHAQASGPIVSLRLRGHATPLRVNAVLGSESFGALSQAHVAVMPLERLQSLSGLSHRVTRILIQAKPGQQQRVRSELGTLAAGRLTVAPADQDVSLLHQALKPAEQASLFFAAISALLGFLFTFNAVLLTVPWRRQQIAELRLPGATRTAIVHMVLFQALCLGVTATLIGLLAGYGLSVGVFAQTPVYLATGFTLGSRTAIGATPLLVAGIGGVLATCLASLMPLLDLRRGRGVGDIYQEDGEVGNALGVRVALRLVLTAAALVVIRVVANSLWPGLALAWCALLAIAAVLCVPLLFAGVLHFGERLAQRFQRRLTLLPLALESLGETTLRSLALVATGAAALFGAVALGGARDDLVRGISVFASHYSREGDVWVVTPNDNQAVTAFPQADGVRRIADLPGVRNVDVLSGGLLDVGNRRVWVLAWPSSSGFGLIKGQIIKGELPTAIARLRGRGWATVSQQLAEAHHVGVGGTLMLPTPSGEVPVRVAALTTNFGWSPGSVVINSADYRHDWQTTEVTALAVRVRAGVNPQLARDEIARTLGPGNGLDVLTGQAREAKMNGSAREGLAQLEAISNLLVLACIFAMVTALASAIWQRRRALAEDKLSGVRASRLRSQLLLESALMLSVGAITGAVWGIYGQIALDGYLTSVTGFPVARLGGSVRPLEVLAVVIILTLAISLLPAWLAARVPASIALEE